MELFGPDRNSTDQTNRFSSIYPLSWAFIWSFPPLSDKEHKVFLQSLVSLREEISSPPCLIVIPSTRKSRLTLPLRPSESSVHPNGSKNNGKAKVSLHSLKWLDEFLPNPHLEQVGERSQGYQSIWYTHTHTLTHTHTRTHTVHHNILQEEEHHHHHHHHHHHQ